MAKGEEQRAMRTHSRQIQLMGGRGSGKLPLRNDTRTETERGSRYLN